MPVEVNHELRTADKRPNGSYCRRCKKPLSGRQKEFCGYGPGSCHALWYSEARNIGEKVLLKEVAVVSKQAPVMIDLDSLTPPQRLEILVRTARRILK